MFVQVMVLLTKFSKLNLPEFSAIEHPHPDLETPLRGPERKTFPYRQFLENSVVLIPNLL